MEYKGNIGKYQNYWNTRKYYMQVFYSKEKFLSLKIYVEALYPNIFYSQVIFLLENQTLRESHAMERHSSDKQSTEYHLAEERPGIEPGSPECQPDALTTMLP